MQKALVLVFISLLFSCNKEKSTSIKSGVWRAQMQITDTEVLPFNFEVTSPKSLKIFNAEEVILVNDITYSNDSIIIKMPVFEGYIAAKLNDSVIEGAFIKDALSRTVPFKAVFGKTHRFEASKDEPKSNISGNWETVFSKGVEGDEYIAKGIFKQDGSKVTGTFRTTTGDYRYLEGVLNGNQLKLSTFDGSHAFLFTATVTDSTFNGVFYSGNHWKEPFDAKRNESFELPNENELTYLNEGYDKVEFTFPNTDGKLISLSDAQYKDKVVIVQLMGTWCPNCLNESRYYSEFYKNNKNKGVEFIALAFEYAKTEASAFKSINRLIDNAGIEYPILLAQFGSSDKAAAQEKLPMLNHVLSYPTTIFIDKTSKVRKIHTGFNGPATGMKYVEFKNEFESFVSELVKE